MLVQHGFHQHWLPCSNHKTTSGSAWGNALPERELDPPSVCWWTTGCLLRNGSREAIEGWIWWRWCRLDPILSVNNLPACFLSLDLCQSNHGKAGGLHRCKEISILFPFKSLPKCPLLDTWFCLGYTSSTRMGLDGKNRIGPIVVVLEVGIWVELLV